MELEQLQQLVTIAKARTISAAAEELHMSQPALSRSVRRLEADLGCELFDRGRNSARLNDAGRLAVEHAGSVLAEVQRMRDAFDELARRLRTLRVASVAPAPIWRVTSHVIEEDPGAILETELAGEQAIERMLVNRACDLAITLRPIHLPTVHSMPLMNEDLSISVPKDHELAALPSVSFAELDGRPFIMLEDVGFWGDVVREKLPGSQFIIQRDQRVFRQLMGSTDVCGFATQESGGALVDYGRVAVPITDVEAHVTFFLNVLEDVPERVSRAYDAVRKLEG